MTNNNSHNGSSTDHTPPTSTDDHDFINDTNEQQQQQTTSFTNRKQPIFHHQQQQQQPLSSSTSSTSSTNVTNESLKTTTTTTKAKPLLSRNKFHHRAEIPTKALKETSSMRLNTKKGFLMFCISMGSALLGAQTVHMIGRPSTTIPDTLPDFIALDKEREEDEKARKIIKGEI